MKVFVSWSGEQSKKLGEALRDWLPGVLQAVKPYFTPSDIEKGARWSTDISKELSNSEIGILCITRENIHSDWILFEAGALSKSLEKSHVCPILFGITNTDLAGPLKQFQTTEFEKGDIQKMLGVINSGLGDQKLPQKTLDSVFEKWWPDLEEKIQNILNHEGGPFEPVRTDRDILEEVLQLSRMASRRNRTGNIAIGAIQDILENYIELHDLQVAGKGGYQDTLDRLQDMEKALIYIARKYKGEREDFDLIFEKLSQLSFSYEDTEKSDDNEVPF